MASLLVLAFLLLSLLASTLGREVSVGTQTTGDRHENSLNPLTSQVMDQRLDCKTAYGNCMQDARCSRPYGSARAMCNQSPEEEEECPDSCREAISMLASSPVGLDYIFCDCGNSPVCSFKLKELHKCTSAISLQ